MWLGSAGLRTSIFSCAPLSEYRILCSDLICGWSAAADVYFLNCDAAEAPELLFLGVMAAFFVFYIYLHYLRFYSKPVIPFGLHDGGTPVLCYLD